MINLHLKIWLAIFSGVSFINHVFFLWTRASHINCTFPPEGITLIARFPPEGIYMHFNEAESRTGYNLETKKTCIRRTTKTCILPLPGKSSGYLNIVFKMARSYVVLGFLQFLDYHRWEMYPYLLSERNLNMIISNSQLR